MARDQLTLFAPAQHMPAGFRYCPELISIGDEREITRRLAGLAFREFEFQGFLGKRRVVRYGWRYDYDARTLERAEQIPEFLLSLRHEAATFGGMPAESLQQVLVTEYSAGVSTGIGWHRDKAVFGEVVGVSLLSACTFRLRRKVAESWERASTEAAPRSAYLLSGPSRSEWEHSIPGVDAVRYSITFRTFRGVQPD